VLLPAGALELALSGSNPSLHEAMRLQLDTGGAASRVQEIRTILRSLLPTGSYGLEQVARYYACDKRTVQRYLRDQADTTFQALLDDVRFDLVMQYLRDSRMTVTQLAYVAGFTDASNFTRAFRKRFGITPRRWREQCVNGLESS
jgi:AraC-like DNA-binding protein